LKLNTDNKAIEQFKVQILYEGADIRINIYCLDPSSGFREVIQQHKPRSIILTSGTLSPLKMWPLELGV
jgi:Rad3-related DNA helicase